MKVSDEMKRCLSLDNPFKWYNIFSTLFNNPFCKLYTHGKLSVIVAWSIVSFGFTRWFHLKYSKIHITLRWRHNGHDGVSNHQPHHCVLNRSFGGRSKKTSKPRVTGLCAGNSPGTGEFPAQMASNAENVSIWWRHHDVMSHIAWVKWAEAELIPGELRIEERALCFKKACQTTQVGPWGYNISPT